MRAPQATSLAPVEDGWAVMLSDGRELAGFTGPDARRKALRYVAGVDAAVAYCGRPVGR
jgi:hypothetical protein